MNRSSPSLAAAWPPGFFPLCPASLAPAQQAAGKRSGPHSKYPLDKSIR